MQRKRVEGIIIVQTMALMSMGWHRQALKHPAALFFLCVDIRLHVSLVVAHC